MKFQTHNQDEIDINGTCLKGSIQATRAEMIKAFGQPDEFEPGDKVQYQWTLRFVNGLVGSIYDWKIYDEFPADMVVSWHIGGHEYRVVEQIHNAFRSAHGLLAEAA